MYDKETEAASDCLSPSNDNNVDDDESARRRRRRDKVIQEILATERTYQNHLELVIQYFEGPLHDLKLIPDHAVVTIFSNIRQILSINQELLEHLGQIGIGQAFLHMGPFFKLYSTYANNHERALGAMIEWEQKVAEFAAWRRAQEELPAMMGLKLNSLLITPVQRVPRYKLLLEDLLENTEKSHEDYAAIQEAVKQISAVASHINEHIKQHDNFNKMFAIQKCLAGPGAPRILTPGRIFIKDGPLKKVSKKGGRSHERMFFLFSDIFMYAKPKFVDQGLSGSYVCCCIFPLHHCQVETVFGGHQSSGSLFTVTCKDESLLLYSDQKTVQSWMNTLNNAIQNVQACRQTLRKPSSALQPLRRPGLIQMRKRQKKDPLATARRTTDQPSPRSLKRALAEANMNCLTPRKSKQMKTEDKPTISQPQDVLSPVCSETDSPRVPAQTDSAVKVRLFANETKTPQSQNNKRKGRNVARNFMRKIRQGGAKKDADEETKDNENCEKVWITSPELARQGPNCNIDEILDPKQEKWDIFDTAPPDTSVVWRARLPTDPPEMERPDPAMLRRKRQLQVSRPNSEISENTSRIWRSSRPFSDISDSYINTSSLQDSRTCDDSNVFMKNEDITMLSNKSVFLKNADSGREGEEEKGKDLVRRYDFDEESNTGYCESSRDFLAKASQEEESGENKKRGIFHKQSDSMLMPWRTEWVSEDSSSNEPTPEGPPIRFEEIVDLWPTSGYPGSVYAGLDDSPTTYSIPSPTHYKLPKRLCAIDEQFHTSPQSSEEDESSYRYDTPNRLKSEGASTLDGPLPHHLVTPKRKPPQSQTKSPWRYLETILETTGEAAQKITNEHNVLLSPVQMNNKNCFIQ